MDALRPFNRIVVGTSARLAKGVMSGSQSKHAPEIDKYFGNSSIVPVPTNAWLQVAGVAMGISQQRPRASIPDRHLSHCPLRQYLSLSTHRTGQNPHRRRSHVQFLRLVSKGPVKKLLPLNPLESTFRAKSCFWRPPSP